MFPCTYLTENIINWTFTYHPTSLKTNFHLFKWFNKYFKLSFYWTYLPENINWTFTYFPTSPENYQQNPIDLRCDTNNFKIP